MLNWKNSLAYRPAHTHNLDLKKGKNTNSLILMLPDAIIKSSTSENVNMIYLENGIMNNPRWLFLKCQHGVSLKCQHGCSNMISTQQCIYIYTCVSSFHCNGLWLSLHSWVSSGKLEWCTAWQARAVKRRCTTTNQLALRWRSSFICWERGFDSKASPSTGPSWTRRVRTWTEITGFPTSTVEKASRCYYTDTNSQQQCKQWLTHKVEVLSD